MMATLQDRAGLDVCRCRCGVREDVVKRASLRNGDKFIPTKDSCHFLRVSSSSMIGIHLCWLLFLLHKHCYIAYNNVLKRVFFSSNMDASHILPTHEFCLGVNLHLKDKRESGDIGSVDSGGKLPNEKWALTWVGWVKGHVFHYVY